MLALTHSLLLAALTAAQSSAPVAVAGAAPTLPEPDPRLFPTIHIARAVGWAADATPTAAAGLAVEAFATGLDHPRWLYVLPNGDVLVAETNAPPRPDDSKGIRGWIMKRVMARAGAGGPSADRISLLRDADGDGRAELKTTFVSDLTSPFGMALVDRDFYVANTDAIVRFDYEPGATAISSPPGPVVALPAGTRNHHWTKGLIASSNGTLLYVTVGSNSNVAEHGMDQESNRAAILEVSLGTRQTRVFASGLRNPNGLAWEPTTGALWTTVNERDGLGDDLVPDYLTSVKPGGFYGWPYSYFGAHVDERVEPQRPELVAAAIVPDYALGAHPAALGLAFYEGSALPARYRGGAFIGLHGSWNRRELAGYKVIFVPFAAGRPAGPAEDVLTGFLSEDDDRAFGRPAGVAVDLRGGLLVADDVGNAVWRVTAAPRGAAR